MQSITYRKLIEKLTLTPEIYEDLKKPFQADLHTPICIIVEK